MTQTIPNIFATSAGENTPGSELDANFTAVQTSLTAEAPVAAATTIDLGALSSNNIVVSGSGINISAFGGSATVNQPVFFVRFLGANTIIYNATSMQTPGAVNLNISAGNEIKATYLGSGNWKVQPFVNPTQNIVFNTITGFLASAITGTSTTASLTVGSGQATDSTNAAYISINTSTSWAVSNGNAINGYQGGTTLPNSSTIHFFVCNGASGSGIFASTSLTPTLPAGYNTYYRRIFSMVTNSSGALLAGSSPIEVDGGAIIFYLGTQILDIVGAAPASANRTLYTLTVPSGIKVQPLWRANSVSASTSMIFTSPDETDVAVGSAGGTQWSTVPGEDINNNASVLTVGSTTGFGGLTTNTSAQIGARSNNGTGQLYFVTRGWKDFRRS